VNLEGRHCSYGLVVPLMHHVNDNGGICFRCDLLRIKFTKAKISLGLSYSEYRTQEKSAMIDMAQKKLREMKKK